MGWPVLICASALAAEVAKLGLFGPAARTILVGWFMLVIPGLAYARLLPLEKDPLAMCVVAVALSLTLDTLLAIVMVLTHVYDPGLALFILIALSLAGAGIRLIHSSRFPSKVR